MAVKCARMDVKISSLIDREMQGEREVRRLRAHIESCARCSATHRELRSARLSARTIRQQDPPVDFWSSICRQMDVVEEPRATSPARRHPRSRIRFRLYPRQMILLSVCLVATGVAVDLVAMTRDHRNIHPQAPTAAAGAGKKEPAENSPSPDLRARSVFTGFTGFAGFTGAGSRGWWLHGSSQEAARDHQPEAAGVPARISSSTRKAGPAGTQTGATPDVRGSSAVHEQSSGEAAMRTADEANRRRNHLAGEQTPGRVSERSPERTTGGPSHGPPPGAEHVTGGTDGHGLASVATGTIR